MTARQETARTPSRPLIRLFWMLHRAAYRATGGRFGLQRPASGSRFGMLRLATVGRRSGKPRLAIIGYYEDGPNLVTLAMNGWGASEPAWWLNLQANPDTVVGLADGPRAVRARAATGTERDRLWARFQEFPGWGENLDGLAGRRPMETTVVVFEPRQISSADEDATNAVADAAVADAAVAGGAPAGSTPDRPSVTSGTPARASAPVPALARGRRLRLAHLWIVPGLAIAVFGSLESERLGIGILPLLGFSIVPDLPRLLGRGQAHAHGQLAPRVVPTFNLMHQPVLPLGLLALGAVGLAPSVLYVGSLAWLGHIVIGLGIGDRVRGRDGFLRPLGLPMPDLAATSVERAA